MVLLPLFVVDGVTLPAREEEDVTLPNASTPCNDVLSEVVVVVVTAAIIAAHVAVDLAAVASFCFNDGCVGRVLRRQDDDDEEGQGRRETSAADGGCMVRSFYCFCFSC